MRWTLGLLLLASAGCGYRQTRMVACPETGCPHTYASASPEGLAGPGTREEKVEPLPPPTPIAPPITPLPDSEPPPPAPPVYTPSSP